MTGIPRAGNTILSCILNQNKDIGVTGNSILPEIFHSLEQTRKNNEAYLNYPDEASYNCMLSSILKSYYSEWDSSYIIDRSSWGTPYNLELIRKYITDDIKIICPVRPVLEILASFVKLFHENGSGGFIDNNIYSNDRLIYRPMDDVRCDEIMMPNGPTDKALFALSQHKNYDGVFHLVEYDDLVYNTKKTIRNIYDFLGIKYFDHSFENLSNSDEINHEFYGIKNLHKIRSTVNKISTKPEDILSEYILEKYKNYEVWR